MQNPAGGALAVRCCTHNNTIQMPLTVDDRSRLTRCIALVACLLLSATLASAQISGLPGAAPAKSSAAARNAPQETAEQARARVQKLLDDTRADEARPPEPVPSGITQSEIEELREAQIKLVGSYDLQLRALEQTDRTAAARTAAENRARDWTGFETPPPYSLLRVDELRESAADVEDRVRLLEAGLTQLRIDTDRVQDDLRRAEQELRRSEEAFDAATSAEAKAQAAWRRKLAAARSRAAAAGATAVEWIAKARGDRLAADRAELDLLKRQIALASRDATFSQDDLAAVQKQLGDRVSATRRELAQLEALVGQRLREQETAATALQSAAPADRALAEVRLASARARAEARRDQADSMRGQMLLNEAMSALWGARHTALQGLDGDDRRIAQSKLAEAAQQLAGRETYLASLERESRTKLAEVEARLDVAGLSPQAIQYLQDELTARREAMLALEKLQNEFESDSRRIVLWVNELDAVRNQRSFRARVSDGWLALRAAIERVWNFELFSIEDSTIANGQELKVSRGVTIGKSIGAVLIFLLGFIAMTAAARGIEKKMVARGFDPARARTGRRWGLAFAVILLLLLTLNLAKIPVTVFAFLGGALAIGAGFGTQTLIKNLVSGMVVLMERQIQVGDIVEVEGVSGTITEVNLRSSTVLTFDGTEAIIPNSVFVENSVTNWTHSDRKVRRVIKIGVAYGSPARQVADMLEECAKRHGLVIADPPPLVIFEDFADSSLLFALHIWLELRPNMSSLQVMSDLRFMIEKQFAEAGISIAYPQRDLHIDSARPLRIELVREEKAPPS